MRSSRGPIGLAVDRTNPHCALPSRPPDAAQNQQDQTRPKIRYRPLRVNLDDENEKWQVIKNATKVRKVKTELYDVTKIFIVPDLTQLEREAEMELRKNLKQIRDQNPGTKFLIKKGKIVKAEGATGLAAP